MPSEIRDGRSPAIQFSDRTWIDESSGIIIIMETLAQAFAGQTFCIRTLFSGFMVDASNIFRFEGLGNVTSGSKFAVEWWIFKPQKSGQQVLS